MMNALRGVVKKELVSKACLPSYRQNHFFLHFLSDINIKVVHKLWFGCSTSLHLALLPFWPQFQQLGVELLSESESIRLFSLVDSLPKMSLIKSSHDFPLIPNDVNFQSMSSSACFLQTITRATGQTDANPLE